VLVARSATSDFALLELDDPPNPDWDLHWAGWDRTSTDPPSAVTIHHPSTDEKRISFEDDPTTTTSYLGSSSPGNGSHIRVADWDLGTTEGGSSGSPLFNPDGRVVGQLHGGYAACGNNEPDWFGRLSVSWAGGGTAASRLSDWLDPAATGATTLDGRDRCFPPAVGFTADPNPATIGQPVSFTSSVGGGTPPYSYAWDFDGDGVTDSTAASPDHTYTAYFSGTVELAVVDATSCPAQATETMLVSGPDLVLTGLGNPWEVCGDGDERIEPGEEWSVPITVRNRGNQTASSARAHLSVAGAPAAVSLTEGEVDFGIVAAGASDSGRFTFLVAPDFAPCGADFTIDLDGITFSGGSSRGEAAILTVTVGGTIQRFLDDGFEDPATWGGLDYPGDDLWAVTTGPGSHTAGEWQRTDQELSSGGDPRRPSGGAGFFAISDSDEAGDGSQTSSILTSPVVNLSGVTSGEVLLECDVYFRVYRPNFYDDIATIEVYDGASWQVVATYQTNTVDRHEVLDVSAHALGVADFQVRFSYQNAAWDYWFAVDNVRLSAPLPAECDAAVSCPGSFIFADGFESGDAGAWGTTAP
jgi:PKD repeat protein